MVMNSHLVNHIYVELVFKKKFISCVNICWQYMHIYFYIIEVLKVIKNLFKVLEVFVI